MPIAYVIVVLRIRKFLGHPDSLVRGTDPYLYQNVTDPEHCLIDAVLVQVMALID